MVCGVGCLWHIFETEKNATKDKKDSNSSGSAGRSNYLIYSSDRRHIQNFQILCADIFYRRIALHN